MPPPERGERSMRAKEKVNVLMVDDQPSKLLTYEAILAQLGENLIKAKSGAEALDLLLKNDVAVVLTDVSMPGMDGFELPIRSASTPASNRCRSSLFRPSVSPSSIVSRATRPAPWIIFPCQS